MVRLQQQKQTIKKTVKRTKSKTKVKKETKNENANKKVHYYGNDGFEGITFSENNKTIKNIMCSGNIVCHKIITDRDKFKPAQVKQFLKEYMDKISNPGMREYVRFRDFSLQFRVEETDKLNYPYFYLHDGPTKEMYYDLINPALSDCVVVFSLTAIMMYAWHLTFMIEKDFLPRLSTLTRTKITYDDVGEFLFGGKDYLKMYREVFRNLQKTIGIKNVYFIVTKMFYTDAEKIAYLLCEIFKVPFTKANIKLAEGDKKKYKVIKEIMNI